MVRGEGVCAWDRGLGWVSRKALVSFFFEGGFCEGYLRRVKVDGGKAVVRGVDGALWTAGG